MEAIVAAILAAGLPLIGKLVNLGALFVKAKVQGLTLPEVEEEIKSILETSSSMDAAENAAAGLPPP
jgi:hypothetical protein